MGTSLLDKKIILVGPYVGSFSEEIFSFHPFVEWVNENFQKTNKIIISTHYNRSFLYKNKNIPIFTQYTKDEENQEKHRHKKINVNDYNIISKEIQRKIKDKYGFSINNIVKFNLGYGSLPNISWYQKRFKKIGERNQKNGDILFIPDISRSEKEQKRFLNYIAENFNNVKVVGDFKTHMHEKNEYFKNLNYDSLYENIIKDILYCKCIVSPVSHWTLIGNLHKVPVFSWGKNVSLFKGTYKFDNNISMIVPYEKSKKDVHILMKSFESFYKKL